MRTVNGGGVEARVQGRVLRLGSRRLLLELNARAGDLDADTAALEADGRTVSWLLDAASEPVRVLGLIAFGDAVKPGAAD